MASTVQEMFHENCENSKFHNFIFYPIYIFTFLYEMFCSFFCNYLKPGPNFSFSRPSIVFSFTFLTRIEVHAVEDD